LLILVLLIAGQAPAAVQDSAAVARQRCLDDPRRASTAGQTDCEAAAARTYERRMNAAYAALMRELPEGARERLRTAQRAWLRFRAAEGSARSALYATRQGTMYVPMEAAAAVNLTRDRMLQLEAYLRAMRIEG
jgi:uncharacterized protein YecT (DUF1311 family)